MSHWGTTPPSVNQLFGSSRSFGNRRLGPRLKKAMRNKSDSAADHHPPAPEQPVNGASGHRPG
eukprot:1429273-Alexandrium_andersonii.AAC.1